MIKTIIWVVICIALFLSLVLNFGRALEHHDLVDDCDIDGKGDVR